MSPPRRGATTVRLERGDDGAARLFWEITRTKVTVTTRFGRMLSAGRSLTRTFKSTAAAEQAFASAIEEKRRDGYADPVRRAAAGAAATKGVSVRNAELEALIDEDPRDPQRYLVYADWLQQQRDARGELIVIHHGLATSDDERELDRLERAEAGLMTAFEEELLGPLAAVAVAGAGYRHRYRSFAWRYGFIRAARLSYVDAERALPLLIEHPSGRFLERLIVGERDQPAVLELLKKKTPTNLDSLVLGDAEYPYGEIAIAPWSAALPRLRTLIACTALDGLEAISGNSLEDVHLAAAPVESLRAMAKAKWPKLRRLHLTLPDAASAEAVRELLQRDVMPSLEHITLRRWVMSYQGGPGVFVPQDALALAVAVAAAERRVSRLDLEMVLTPDGARALLPHARELATLSSFRIPAAAVPDQALRTELSRAIPSLTWTPPPEENELGSLDAFAHRPPAES